MESQYPALNVFVQRSSPRPAAIVQAGIDSCFAQLAAGSVQSVLTDMPLINWYLDNYDIEGMYVSPVLKPNPFSFVFRNTPSSAALRSLINPAVIASTTDPVWMAQVDEFRAQYAFNTVPPGALTPVNERLNRQLLAIAVSLACITGAVALYRNGMEAVHEARDSLCAAAELARSHVQRLRGAAAAAGAKRQAQRDAEDGTGAGAEGTEVTSGDARVLRVSQLLQTAGGAAAGDGGATRAELAELAALARSLVAKIQALEDATSG